MINVNSDWMVKYSIDSWCHYAVWALVALLSTYDHTILCISQLLFHLLITREVLQFRLPNDKVMFVITLDINPLTPELNPSAQRWLPRVFTGDFNF
jgi:hypothetical protein